MTGKNGIFPVSGRYAHTCARIGESGAKYLADYGRNTELFLKNSGVKMPTFKSADFSAWTDSGYREKRFNDISGRYEGLRNKLSEETEKAEGEISAGGSKLAGALNETAEKVKSTSKAFVVSSFDAFEKGSLEAAKAESMVFERNTDPVQKESDKIKKSGMVLSDSMLQASNAVKAAAKTFSFHASSIKCRKSGRKNLFFRPSGVHGWKHCQCRR